MSNEREKVMLWIPGPNVTAYTMQNCLRTQWEVSRLPERDAFNLAILNMPGSNGWVNHNMILSEALNACDEQGGRYLILLHADVDPSPMWVPNLVNIMRRNPHLGLVSVPVAIKDDRGLLSCGMGDTTDQWWPYRRLTIYELAKLPKLATEADLFDLWQKDRPNGTFLIHNNGCFILDLHHPGLRKKVDNGYGTNEYPHFSFPSNICRAPANTAPVVPHELSLLQARSICGQYQQDFEKVEGGTALVMADRCEEVGYTAGAALLRHRGNGQPIRWRQRCNPEDFNFSRMVYLAGMKTAIATEIATDHWFDTLRINSHKCNRPGQPLGYWKFDHDPGHSDALTEAERKQIKTERAWFADMENGKPVTNSDPVMVEVS